MKTIALAAALLAAGIASAQAQHAHGSGHAGHAKPAASTRAGTLEIQAPWSRATPGGAKVAGGYLVVRNTGSAGDRLIGGASDVAGRIEIHEMATVDGTMRMRALDKGLAIAPGASVELKPGGYHVMFLDLKQPLKEGQRFKATLTFEKAGAVPLEFEVRSLGAGSHMAH